MAPIKKDYLKLEVCAVTIHLHTDTAALLYLSKSLSCTSHLSAEGSFKLRLPTPYFSLSTNRTCHK